MRSSSLLALTLSLSLAAPLAAHAAGERRAPVTTDPAGIAAHIGLDRQGDFRAGRLFVSTGNKLRGGAPELQLTTSGALQQQRIAGMRSGAARFMHPMMKVPGAGAHDPTREIIVARGTLPTKKFGGYVAMLAIGDPLHPASQARLADIEGRNGPGIDEETLGDLMNDHGHEGSKTPWGQRAHILVVPTTIKEHVTAKLGSPFRKDQLRLTLELHEVAEALGKQLGLADLDVFQNDAFGASVGQEHIHIVGRRTSATTPDIEPPAGGRARGYRTVDGNGRVVPMGPNGLPASSR